MITVLPANRRLEITSYRAVLVERGLLDGLAARSGPLSARTSSVGRALADDPAVGDDRHGRAEAETSSTMWVDRITTTFSPISASSSGSGCAPRVEASGRLVDDDQLGIADQARAMPNRCSIRRVVERALRRTSHR